MSYAVRITWASGKSEEFRGEGEREAFMLSFFGGSGGAPMDVVVSDIPEEEDDPPQATQYPAKEPEKSKAKVEATKVEATKVEVKR